MPLVLLLAGLTFSLPCRADDPVKGEATFSAAGGYARLVLKLAEDVESEVTTAGSIIVIRFKRPVDIPVDKLSDAVPDYVGSARRDPDGSAIRLSLARRATINTMTAGERIFVDFLPDSWTGPPPSLPPDVIRELSARARAAERAAARPARGRAGEEETADPRPRLGAADIRALRVRNARWRQRLVGPERAEADPAIQRRADFRSRRRQGAAPPNVASINQRVDADMSAVDITLIGEVDVHSFREEKNYIVDVAFQQAEKPAAAEAATGPLHRQLIAPGRRPRRSSRRWRSR